MRTCEITAVDDNGGLHVFRGEYETPPSAGDQEEIAVATRRDIDGDALARRTVTITSVREVWED